MTQPEAGAALPDSVCALLDGSGLDDEVSTTVLLATTSPDCWPNLAMLSHPPDPHRVRPSAALARRRRRRLPNSQPGTHVPDPPVPGDDALAQGIGYDLQDVAGARVRWQRKLARLRSLD